MSVPFAYCEDKGRFYECMLRRDKFQCVLKRLKRLEFGTLIKRILDLSEEKWVQTLRLVHELKVTQRTMEQGMFGISFSVLRILPLKSVIRRSGDEPEHPT